MIADRDIAHLRHAIALSVRARTAGDPPFGSVLVDADETVLAEAWNTTLSERDITAHPELKLARWAARHLDADRTRAVALYTSCRPCPMCTNAIARSPIGRVVFALDTADLEALKPPGHRNPDAGQVDYQGPALTAEASAPLLDFYRPGGDGS